MASQIRYLVLMLLVLIALAATACSDNEPLPDIDATVEASVKRAIASLVVPTLAPLPTLVPVPTTYWSQLLKPTATPVKKLLIVTRTKEPVVEKTVIATSLPVPSVTPTPSRRCGDTEPSERLPSLRNRIFKRHPKLVYCAIGCPSVSP